MKILALLLLFSSIANAQFVCKTKLQTYYALKIYDITLCKKLGVNYGDIFKDSFSIALKYRMPSSSGWIKSRTLNEMEKLYNLSNEEIQSYEKYFSNFFPSVKSGDEIKLEFVPNYGAKLYYNGKLFREVKDVTLATRMTSIWLHPNSAFKDTRNFLFSGE